MGFYKCECRVVHLGGNIRTRQSRRGADPLEKSSAQKDLGVLVDTRLAIFTFWR